MQSESAGSTPAFSEPVVGHEDQLSPEDLKRATAFFEQMRKANLAAQSNMTDPSTRPSFGPAVQAKTGEKGTIPADHPILKRVEKGGKPGPLAYLPPSAAEITPGGAAETDAQRLARFAEVDPETKTLYVNHFPRGDMDNFRVTRWAMAQERSLNTLEGNLAFAKYAP